MKPLSLFAALSLSLALTAHSPAQVLQTPSPVKPAEPSIYDRPASSRPLPADVVVAQGDVELTLTDIDARISRIPPDSRANFINDPERIETLLRNMLLNRQMASEAQAMGIDKDPVVAADIEYSREEVLAKRRSTLLVKDIKFPSFETLAKERYIANPQMYRTPEVISVRHVLFARDKHGDETAHKMADDLHAEIVANNGDFAEYVAKYSDDKLPDDAKPGAEPGLIEDIERGEASNDFESAAFALKNVGDISPVVRTRFGYHIIKLEKRTAPRRYEYDKVKPGIVEELRQEFMARSRQDFIDKTRSVPIDANPQLIQSLRTRYLPEHEGSLAIRRFDSAVSASDLKSQIEAGAQSDAD